MRPRSSRSARRALLTWVNSREPRWEGLAEDVQDLLADAAGADHRVGEVDDRVPGGVQAGQDGADGDGLARADLAGDDADGALADAPGDAGDGLVVGGVAVQHPGGEVAAERHAAEPVVGLQLLDHSVSPGFSVAALDAGDQVFLAFWKAASSAGSAWLMPASDRRLIQAMRAETSPGPGRRAGSRLLLARRGRSS